MLNLSARPINSTAPPYGMTGFRAASAAFTGEPGRSEKPPHRAREPHLAMSGRAFVPSIAETAGLKRFAYLHGQSGTRYVFSRIQCRQMALYRNAIIAAEPAGGGGGGKMWVGSPEEYQASIAAGGGFAGHRLFVHLLAKSARRRSEVLADLRAV